MGRPFNGKGHKELPGRLVWFDDRGSGRVAGTKEVRALEAKFRISDFTPGAKGQQLMILSWVGRGGGEVIRYAFLRGSLARSSLGKEGSLDVFPLSTTGTLKEMSLKNRNKKE